VSFRRALGALLTVVSVGLFRVAALRYPAPLREAHGEDMLSDMCRLAREALEQGGVGRWAGVTARILGDVLRPMPSRIERYRDRPRPRIEMSRGVRRGLLGYASDVTGAMRALRRSPGFATLVIGVLAVGVSLNVATLAVVDAYLLESLPYPESRRLVEVRPATTAVTPIDAETVFERSVAWELDGFTLVGGANPEVTLGAFVSSDFFEVFGVVPALGRTFGPEETGPDGASVALISYGLWERRFGRDPTVLGTAIQTFTGDGTEVGDGLTIIGVLPRDFWYLNEYTEVLAPLRHASPVRIGRLRADVTPRRAETILARLAATGWGGPGSPPRIRVRSLQAAYSASVRPKLLAFQAAALLALLVACVNAGLLLVVRGLGRREEMGVRRALGADSRRLAAHFLSEGLLLSLAAGAVGVAIAWATLDVFGPLLEDRLGRAVPGGVGALRLDSSTVMAAVGISVLIGLLVGSGSLWASTRANLHSLIRPGGRRMTAILVGTEIALSLTLLTGGAGVVRSAVHLATVRLGFDPAGLTSFTVGFTTDGSEDPGQRVRFFEELAERASTLPGIEVAAIVRAAPFANRLTTRVVEAEGRASERTPSEAVPQIASPELLEALRLSVIRGRGFNREDGPAATRVALVSESLASRLWVNADPLGRRLRFPSWSMPDMEEREGSWLVVVGVVPDHVDQLEESRPTVYYPFRQAPSAWMTLLVRRRPGTSSVADGVRDILSELNPEVPIYSEVDIAKAVATARAPASFLAALLGGLAVFSVLLAVVGLYGVTQFAARRRRSEVAVRLALGADRASVGRLFVRDSLASVLPGLVIGVFGGHMLVIALRGQLHGLRPDALTMPLVTAALLGATAVLAVWVAVLKVSASGVSTVLREE
jgi:putative ABC transport system permease protein